MYNNRGRIVFRRRIATLSYGNTIIVVSFLSQIVCVPSVLGPGCTRISGITNVVASGEKRCNEILERANGKAAFRQPHRKK